MIVIVGITALVGGIAAGAFLARRFDLRELRAGLGPDLAGDARSLEGLAESLRIRCEDQQAETRRQVEILERLEIGLESSDIGVIVADDDGTVVLRNAVANTFAEARHSEALVASTVNELLEAARRGVGDERLVELVGPPARSYRVSAHVLHRDDRVIGSVAFISDVSESRRIEKIRRDFVANVSHELKTPIGALSLLAETMTVDDEPAVLERLIERVQTEAQRVADTIDDLMTLSAIEEREGARFEPVDVHDVVAAAVDRLVEAAELAGVDLRRPEGGSPLMVVGERVQLESAVYNLVDNAIKYCERGDRVEVRLASGGGKVAIAIQDEGVGIPASELSRIFERFYRVDKARSRVTGGTGLGLAIVRHVIQNHGGEIDVASREGEGSTFTVLLPLQEHDAVVVPADTSSALLGSRKPS